MDWRGVVIMIGMLPLTGLASGMGVKPLIEAALRAEGQPVTVTLDGAVAQYIQSHTRSMQPVNVTAQRIAVLQPDGCGRVRLIFKQQAVEFPMEINWCLDGSVPEMPTTEGSKP